MRHLPKCGRTDRPDAYEGLRPADNRFEDAGSERLRDIGIIAYIGNRQLQSIPIVAATAAGYVEEEELKRKGFAAVLSKPYSIDELLTVTENCIKWDKTSCIDLSPLLAFSDKRRTLEKLATTTQADMEEVRKTAEAKDMKALDNRVHHLRSSWMLIKAEQPLKVLYDAIHKESISDEELGAAVGAVLAQGKLIVDLARKEAERWAE